VCQAKIEREERAKERKAEEERWKASDQRMLLQLQIN